MHYPLYHSAPLAAPIKWGGEGSDVGTDPVSGAVVRRLTSGPLMNHLIYCEQPYASPDGSRVALIRGRDFTFEDDFALLIAEPRTLRLALVERAIPRTVVHHLYSDWLYYCTHERGLRRVSFTTLAKEQVLPDGAVPADFVPESMPPDERTIFGYLRDPSGVFPSVAIDLPGGEVRTYMRHPDNRNPHLQVQPVHGRLLLQQLIRPGRVPVVMMRTDGSDLRELPVGDGLTAESSGHMAWLPGSERMVVAVEWDREARRHDPRHPQGNLVIAGYQDETPTIFAAPEHGFYHVSVSRCGLYFVGDDFMAFTADTYRQGHLGPARIVVGCFATGRYRVLVADCLAYGLAGASNWEPVPYFTGDNRYVIFNSSPFGTNQVFAAELPPGFLASMG